ncbi:MAG: zinc metalloprotease HtpX [Actinomycetota bacterium]|nr:zinc metalloprotease HtpX [Actinomycetota bacterium]
MVEHHRIRADKGLATRMGLTMFMLLMLYAAVFGALIAIGISAILVLAIAAGVIFVQYWFSASIALYAMGGREVSPAQAPQLHAIVDRLCAMADMRKPRVAIASSDIPNAFATGRSPNAAVVCATTGILRRLNEQELEAVLAHELSHVAHRDVAVMTIASFLGIVAGLMTRVALYAGMLGGFGGGGGRDNEGEQAALIELAVIVVSALVYAISFLLTRALSRYRELAADRSGAILIGRPSILASALVKVTGEMARIPTRDLRSAEHFNAFYFAPAIANGVSLSTLFSTHPPLQRRLDQLAKLEAEMNRPA